MILEGLKRKEKHLSLLLQLCDPCCVCVVRNFKANLKIFVAEHLQCPYPVPPSLP